MRSVSVISAYLIDEIVTRNKLQIDLNSQPGMYIFFVF